MHKTRITRKLALAGFAPAGKLSHTWTSGRRAITGPLAVGALLFSAATALWSQDAQTYTYSVLHTFTGAPDGSTPTAGLVLDNAGNLYGTTTVGGNTLPPPPPYNACDFQAPGCGVVFKIGPKGKESILYSFTGGADGGSNGSNSTLVRDEAGNLYGTTSGGGDLSCYGIGCGVVFKLDPAGNETVLHAFTGGADGASLLGSPALFRDKAGNLYGTAPSGGDLTCGINNGCGVVYKIDPAGPAGNEAVLYTFNGVGVNYLPDQVGPLVRDGAGNFYGTTAGAVFKLDPAGKETLLYTFSGANTIPEAGLIRDKDGNLYGTVTNGLNTGAVFELDAAGKETVLYSFPGNGFTGARLVRDPAGNLYGTTPYGGKFGAGMVYKLDPAGNETVLYSFFGGRDGYGPGTLVLDENGNLYGTTGSGGDLTASACSEFGGCGVVFKLTRAAAGGQ